MNERSRFVAQASSLQPMQPGMAALRSESPTIGSCAPGALCAGQKEDCPPSSGIMCLRRFGTFVGTALALLAANFCQAQQLVISPDRATGIYQIGETIHWRVEWKDKTNPPPVHYQ